MIHKFLAFALAFILALFAVFDDKIKEVFMEIPVHWAIIAVGFFSALLIVLLLRAF